MRIYGSLPSLGEAVLQELSIKLLEIFNLMDKGVFYD
jgi:hypothetical protein